MSVKFLTLILVFFPILERNNKGLRTHALEQLYEESIQQRCFVAMHSADYSSAYCNGGRFSLGMGNCKARSEA